MSSSVVRPDPPAGDLEASAGASCSADNSGRHTPLESLLLILYIGSFGLSASTFSRIADLLVLIDHITTDPSYLADRLTAPALTAHFLTLVRDEVLNFVSDERKTSTEPAQQVELETIEQDARRIASLDDSLRFARVVPRLACRLYDEFVENQIRLVQEAEEDYLRLRREMDEIERGEWDDRIEMMGKKVEDLDVAPPARPEADKMEVDEADEAKETGDALSTPLPAETAAEAESPAMIVEEQEQNRPVEEVAPSSQNAHSQPASQTSTAPSQIPETEPELELETSTEVGDVNLADIGELEKSPSVQPSRLPSRSPSRSQSRSRSPGPSPASQLRAEMSSSLPKPDQIQDTEADAGEGAEAETEDADVDMGIEEERQPEREKPTVAIDVRPKTGPEPEAVAGTEPEPAKPVTETTEIEIDSDSGGEAEPAGDRRSAEPAKEGEAEAQAEERAAEEKTASNDASAVLTGPPTSAVPPTAPAVSFHRPDFLDLARRVSQILDSPVVSQTFSSRASFAQPDPTSPVFSIPVRTRTVSPLSDRHWSPAPSEGVDPAQVALSVKTESVADGSPGRGSRSRSAKRRLSGRSGSGRDDRSDPLSPTGESDLDRPPAVGRATSSVPGSASVAAFSAMAPQVRPTYVAATRNFPRLTAPIMYEILSHRHASVFANPVKPKDAEGYHDIIRRPQDLKSLRAAMNGGSRALTAAIAATADDESIAVTELGLANAASPSVSTPTPVTTTAANPAAASLNSAAIVYLPLASELVPPKAVVNSVQLQCEMTRMFANAVMFSPGEDGIVKDAREMYENVSQILRSWRQVERAGMGKKSVVAVGVDIEADVVGLPLDPTAGAVTVATPISATVLEEPTTAATASPVTEREKRRRRSSRFLTPITPVEDVKTKTEGSDGAIEAEPEAAPDHAGENQDREPDGDGDGDIVMTEPDGDDPPAATKRASRGRSRRSVGNAPSPAPSSARSRRRRRRTGE